MKWWFCSSVLISRMHADREHSITRARPMSSITIDYLSYQSASIGPRLLSMVGSIGHFWHFLGNVGILSRHLRHIIHDIQSFQNQNTTRFTVMFRCFSVALPTSGLLHSTARHAPSLCIARFVRPTLNF